MEILLCGFDGHMGKEVRALTKNEYRGIKLKAGVDPNVSAEAECPCAKDFSSAEKNVDCIVDFSNHVCTKALLSFAKEAKLPVVIATTGQTEDELAEIKAASKEIPVFFSGNMSLGIAVLCRLAKQAAAALPEADIEILEVHHNRKVDAPSGTAKMLFEAVKSARPEAQANCGRAGEGKRQPGEVGISSMRMGNIVGIHEVHISTGNQTLSLRHEAHDRGMFAEGAVEAAAFLQGKAPGLYTMTDLLEAK